jgi:chromobox protein 5
MGGIRRVRKFLKYLECTLNFVTSFSFRDYNTWEPIENLNCDQLIEEFESERKAKAAAKATPKSKHSTTSQEVKKNTSSTNQSEPLDSAYFAEKYTFDDFDKLYKNLELEKVIGGVKRENRLWLLIKWRHVIDCDLVPLDYVRYKFAKLNDHMKELLYFTDIK